jgi:aspartyl-tRNA(Asn)/glutamyl-tRNA(Gln) amidotransferase subunit C
MSIDKNTVERLAELARLGLNEEQKAAIEKDLNKMLGFVEKLNEVNVDGVEPLIFMTEEVNLLREDEATLTITKEDALKNAPKRDSDYFKVPKVLDKK